MKTSAFFVAILFLLTSCVSLPFHEHSVGIIRRNQSGQLVTCADGKYLDRGQILKVFSSDCRRDDPFNFKRGSRAECIEKKDGQVRVVSNNNLHEILLEVVGDGNVTSQDYILF